MGELKLFAGADKSVEAVQERASRKRKGIRVGASGGMSMIGLEEHLEQEELQLSWSSTKLLLLREKIQGKTG